MKTILVIEDNPEILENITELLELASFKVLTAKNGREGIVQAIENLPNVILCDIMMPEVNGYEVLRELKKNKATTHIPFIFVTASGEKSEVQTAVDLGASGHLRKPFDSNELLNIINSHLKV
jgi:CheY-like chemotaxis protein